MGTDLIVVEAAHSVSMHLARYDAACRAIAELHAIDELLNIKNGYVALQAYAHEARNFEIEQMAADIRVRAEFKAGELLIEMMKAGLRETGRPQKGTKVGTRTSRPTLGEMGITRSESRKWRRLFLVGRAKLEAALADKTTIPTAASIIRANEEPKHKTSVSSEAVALWSFLRDFENDGLLDKDPAEVLSTMTQAMLEQVHTRAAGRQMAKADWKDFACGVTAYPGRRYVEE
jgi:hypothetical protein